MKRALLLFTLFLITNLAQATIQTNAADYITSTQTQDGQFNQLGTFVTAPSIVALHVLNSTKYENQIQLGANYLANQHHDGCISTWCSKQGHIPDETGISLWALAETNNLNLLPENGSAAIQKIKEAQTEQGDFASDEGTNTEHTVWALIALSATHSLTQQSANKAINYIATHWQEKNGAIKQSYESKNGVNGEQEYYTALTVWALAYSNNTNNSVYQLALANLITKSENCFNNSTHVLTVATAKLALDASNVTNELRQCILKLQHSNGGFRDSVRASATENAFDTAFALLSLTTTPREKTPAATTIQTKENTNKTITLKITQNNQTQEYKVTCEKAIDCLTQAANVKCKYYSAPGLTCQGTDKACYIEQINDNPKQIELNQWAIYLNTKLTDQGISCLEIQNNDEIELKLQNNFNPYSEEKTYSLINNEKNYLMLGLALFVLISITVIIIKKTKGIE